MRVLVLLQSASGLPKNPVTGIKGNLTREALARLLCTLPEIITDAHLTNLVSRGAPLLILLEDCICCPLLSRPQLLAA